MWSARRHMEKRKNLKMQQLPVSERPYEKCLEQGPAALSGAELLAVLLKCGTRDESASQLAARLLAAYSGPHTLADIFDAGIDELTEIKGIGRVKAITLQCVGELSRRISSEKAKNRIQMTTPASVAGFFMERMRRLTQEEIRAAFFDTKSNFIRDCLISKGTVNASVVTPREIFIEALRYKAVYVILLHNHPSGDPSPSPEDIRLTRQIAKAGEMLQITLADHIIIGDGRFFSMREKHVI